MATTYRPISFLVAEVGYGYGWDLAAALRASKISIRDLAAYLGVTQRRVRHVRDVGVARFPFLVGLDYYMAVRTILKFRKTAAELRKAA
jgi:hypothetical protein